MPTLSPSDVLAASDFVATQLDASKRRSLLTLQQLMKTIDPADIARSLQPVLPRVAQVMHQQQAAGRVVAWTQAQLAASLATGVTPGEAVLGISTARDGLMLSGASFESVTAPTTPGILSRIAQGIDPVDAIQQGQQILASMVGSVAHDEARMTTMDVVTGDTGDAQHISGYARRTEGAFTCDFCRMLATRGPVYSKDTAGFKAHAFCDCTTYAVAMQDFTTNPGDWDAYQRWAKTHGGSPKGGTTLSPKNADGHVPGSTTVGAQTQARLKAIDAQLAAYEPVVANGAGTQWMRDQVAALKAERQSLTSAGIGTTSTRAPLPPIEPKPALAPAPDLTPKPWRHLSHDEAVQHVLGPIDVDDATRATRLAEAHQYAEEWATEAKRRALSLDEDELQIVRSRGHLKEERKRLRDRGLTESQIRRDDVVKYYQSEVKHWQEVIERSKESVQVGQAMADEAVRLIPLVESTGRSSNSIRNWLLDVDKYEFHVSGPHTVRVANGSSLAPTHLTRLLEDAEASRLALPEWRRVTFDGRERPFTLTITEDLPNPKGIACGTVGDAHIWVQPGIVTRGAFPWHEGVAPGEARAGHIYTSSRGALRDTLDHELGHNLDVQHGSNPATKAIHDRVLADESLLAEMSEYGRTNELEGYAETYARWVMEPGSTSPLVRAYADEFGWDLTRAEYDGIWREVVTDAYTVP